MTKYLDNELQLSDTQFVVHFCKWIYNIDLSFVSTVHYKCRGVKHSHRLCFCWQPVKVLQPSAYATLRDGKTDRSMPASVAQCIKSKQLSTPSQDIAYPQILQEIADTHKFSVTFVDVMEPTDAGETWTVGYSVKYEKGDVFFLRHIVK